MRVNDGQIIACFTGALARMRKSQLLTIYYRLEGGIPYGWKREEMLCHDKK
jgi:hypothetical protein